MAKAGVHLTALNSTLSMPTSHLASLFPLFIVLVPDVVWVKSMALSRYRLVTGFVELGPEFDYFQRGR